MTKQSAAPTATPVKKTSKGVSKPIVKKRGANSNYYLARLLEKDPGDLTADQLKEVAALVRDSHRITPVAASRASEGRTVFTSVTGHHEWLPTDRAFQIVTSGIVWSSFYSGLRSPTWLLMVNPARYCADPAAYVAGLQAAAKHALAGKGATVRASTLGFVGHSGGLSLSGTQLTQFQSTWHDELRDIYDKHAAANAYDAYWNDLKTFIEGTFLFASTAALPLCGANVGTVSNDDLMKSIQWDLTLSGRGNPSGVAMDTLYDVAQFLRSEWVTWGRYLDNTFRASRSYAA